MNPLLPLIHKFLRLETLAHELYRAHLPHVPTFAKKDFREFIRVEEEHRRMFERLYRKVSNVKQHPRFPFSVFAMKVVAKLVSFGGFRTICRFECFIERHAIADYEAALQTVKHTQLRGVIKRVLQDEKSHPSLPSLLQRFLADEQEHIHTMEKVLQKKISTVTR